MWLQRCRQDSFVREQEFFEDIIMLKNVFYIRNYFYFSKLANTDTATCLMVKSEKALIKSEDIKCSYFRVALHICANFAHVKYNYMHIFKKNEYVCLQHTVVFQK